MSTTTIAIGALALGGVYFATRKRGATEPEIGIPDPENSGQLEVGASIGWAKDCNPKIVQVREVFEPHQWIEDDPMLGRFLRCDRRTHPEKVAREMVRQVAQKAGEARKLDPAEIQQWADEMSRDARLVRASEDLLHAAGWNDETAGSPIVERRGPHGRGIDFRPVHDDQPAILVRGGTPRRNLDSAGRVVSEARRAYPLIWIPKLNHHTFGAVILDGAPGEPITSLGVSWENGTSAAWPPPVVADRGVIHGKTH